MVCKKETQDKCLISLFNHIGIETGNRKESESISRIGIGIGIDKIQTIPKPYSGVDPEGFFFLTLEIF